MFSRTELYCFTFCFSSYFAFALYCYFLYFAFVFLESRVLAFPSSLFPHHLLKLKTPALTYSSKIVDLSTIGAHTFNDPVRDGVGWDHVASNTGESLFIFTSFGFRLFIFVFTFMISLGFCTLTCVSRVLSTHLGALKINFAA